MIIRNRLASMDKNKAMKIITDFWNDRYSADKYVYGINPNAFFKSEIGKTGKTDPLKTEESDPLKLYS